MLPRGTLGGAGLLEIAVFLVTVTAVAGVVAYLLWRRGVIPVE
ncbi:hypothetical protein [Halonotius pteroides]|jgi:hypothetical protein|nr:hypothetical protein [Halonotius pteroides]